jgi:hypothetical protein
MVLTVRDSPTPRQTSGRPSAPPTRPATARQRSTAWRVLVVAVVVLAVANLAVLAWAQLTHRRTDARAADLGVVTTELAEAQEVEARQRAALGELHVALSTARAQVDSQIGVLEDTTGARDGLREQLVGLRAQLGDVQTRLDANYGTIVGQNNVIEHLRGCFGGVQRALNLAAFDRDAEAAFAVLQVAEQCANAQAALHAGAEG